DNSDRTDAFAFSSTRLRTSPTQGTMAPLSQFPSTTFSVPAGGVNEAPDNTDLAKVVFLIDAPAAGGVIYYLNHASEPGQSVLMVSQTTYGPLVSSGFSALDLDDINGSPFLGSSNCADSGSYHN
ncbi:MAG: hypothetical protein AAGH65_07125, partial [Pseudomonadota bacterium]